VYTLLVGSSELGFSLASLQRQGQLCHGMHVLGQVADEGLHVLGQLAAGSQLLGQAAGLLGGGDLGSEQQPDQGLRDGLTLASRALEGGQLLLQLGDTVAAEADTLLSIQQGGLVVHALDITATTNALLDGDVAKGLVSIVLLELLQLLLLAGDLITQSLLQRLLTIKCHRNIMLAYDQYRRTQLNPTSSPSGWRSSLTQILRPTQPNHTIPSCYQSPHINPHFLIVSSPV
jgi:hypothetical protein